MSLAGLFGRSFYMYFQVSFQVYTKAFKKKHTLCNGLVYV